MFLKSLFQKIFYALLGTTLCVGLPLAASAFSITTDTTLPTGYVGQSYGPVTLETDAAPGDSVGGATVTLGSTLPAGLILGMVNPALSGTPTTAGNYSFTIELNNYTTGEITNKSFSLVITEALAITTTSPLPDGIANLPYSTTIEANQPSASFSIAAGSLPAGLVLGLTSGLLMGTPTTMGIYAFTVEANNATTGQFATKEFSLTITDLPLIITTASPLPNGETYQAYDTTITTNKGLPSSYELAAGTLPVGIIFTGNGLGGTPTIPGTYTFTVKVIMVGPPYETAEKAFSLTINPPATPLAIVTPSPLLGGYVGIDYSPVRILTNRGANFQIPVTLLSGALPAGLILGITSGEIMGTPTTVGVYNFTLEANDANTNERATKEFRLTIFDNSILVITTTSPLPDGIANLPYSTTIEANQPSASFSITAGSLPAGLVLGLTSGLLMGTPTTMGIYAFTVEANNATTGQFATKEFSLTILSAGPAPFLPPTNFRYELGTGNTGHDIKLLWDWTGLSATFQIDQTSDLGLSQNITKLIEGLNDTAYTFRIPALATQNPYYGVKAARGAQESDYSNPVHLKWLGESINAGIIIRPGIEPTIQWNYDVSGWTNISQYTLALYRYQGTNAAYDQRQIWTGTGANLLPLSYDDTIQTGIVYHYQVFLYGENVSLGYPYLQYIASRYISVIRHHDGEDPVLLGDIENDGDVDPDDVYEGQSALTSFPAMRKNYPGRAFYLSPNGVTFYQGNVDLNSIFDLVDLNIILKYLRGLVDWLPPTR